MGEMRKIEILIDSDIAEGLSMAARQGGYADESALVNDALALWRSYRDQEQASEDELRAIIGETIARDEWLEGNFSLEQITAEGDVR